MENGIHFDETRYSNDVVFSTLTGCKAKDIKVVNRVLYVVTEHEGSLTHSFCQKKGELEIRSSVCFRMQKIIVEYGYRFPMMPMADYLHMMYQKDKKMFRDYFKRLPEIPYSYWDACHQTASFMGKKSRVKFYAYALYCLLIG